MRTWPRTWTTRLVATAAGALLLLACDSNKASPPEGASSRTTAAVRYDRAVRAALIVAVHRSTEKEPVWYGCSGVLVDAEKRRALTAHHCIPRIEGSPVLCMFFPPTESSRRIDMSELDERLASGGSRCSVLLDEPDADLAVLHLEDPLPSGAHAIALAAKEVQVGDPVHGVLAPHLIPNTWFTGYVNNRVGSMEGLKMAAGFQPNQPLFGFTTPVASGASGGMVLDDEGRLVGITIAGVYDTATGVAVPVSTISQRLAKLAGS